MSTIVNNLGGYFQAGETLAANDALYIDNITGKVHKFNVIITTQVFAGFAKESAVLDDFIFVYQSGRAKGFTGLVPGKFVYASTTVPGGFQLVEPIDSQKIVFGIAKSATEITINGGLGIKPGGSGGAGGGLDTYYVQDMEGLANVDDFSTGNNADFMGGGTLQGALSFKIIAPISGTKSLRYTQAVGSVNDYFASPVIDLDVKQRSNTSGMTLYFEYGGNDNDGRFVIYDVTNSRELAGEVNFVKVASTATRYSLSFFVPDNCDQIRWGYKVLVQNTGKALIVDDIELSTNPFMAKDLINISESSPCSFPTLNWQGLGTITSNLLRCRREGEDLVIFGSFVTGTVTAAEAQIPLPINFGSISVGVSSTRAVGSWFRNLSNASHGGPFLLSAGVNLIKLSSVGTFGSAVVNPLSPTSGTEVSSTVLVTVDNLRIPIQGWTTNTSNILLPSDTFSTDSAPLSWSAPAQYTLTTLENAPIGSYITFQYAANTNTRTQCATRPTQTDASMNVNGMQIFTRAYNAASTAASPAAFAVQIGKGMKGTSLGLYKDTAKLVTGSLDYDESGLQALGLTYSNYNPVTGIIYLDAARCLNATQVITQRTFLLDDLSSQTNGYLTINAGRTLPLLAVPIPLVAYLKDVKPSGTAGGTFTAGAWQTRTLNTVEGDSQIVSLSGNQFTLGPGKYEIEASAPAFRVDRHKIRLIDTNNPTSIIYGSTEFSQQSTSTSVSKSSIFYTLNLSTASTFEVQHIGNNTSIGSGYGIALDLSVPEIYTQVSIKKIG